MKHKKIRSESVIEIGHGAFGIIYSGITGQAAVDFLIQKKSGEVPAAFIHPTIGAIDLVWGRETTSLIKGFGLAKIKQKHPEVLLTLETAIQNSRVVEELPDRCILLCEEHGQQSIVDLQFNNTNKKWLLTSYFIIK